MGPEARRPNHPAVAERANPAATRKKAGVRKSDQSAPAARPLERSEAGTLGPMVLRIESAKNSRVSSMKSSSERGILTVQEG
jgi:hypothetical protein